MKLELTPGQIKEVQKRIKNYVLSSPYSKNKFSLLIDLNKFDLDVDFEVIAKADEHTGLWIETLILNIEAIYDDGYTFTNAGTIDGLDFKFKVW